ncbi:13054_t:CDS:2, partial [Acaulospora colombiana]
MMFKRSLCAIVGGILALTPVNALLAEGLSHEQLAKIRQQLKDRAHVSPELAWLRRPPVPATKGVKSPADLLNGLTTRPHIP